MRGCFVNLESLVEIRENKQVKDLYKKGELELENKNYVQTAFGRKREKVRSQRKRRNEEKRRVREGEVCRTLLSINPKVWVECEISSLLLENVALRMGNLQVIKISC